MIQSMTGFGRSQTDLEGLQLTVEVNSVNRRNLEIYVSLPREWLALEREIQSLVRKSVHRGKLNINIQGLPSGSQAGFHWDEAGLEASLERLMGVASRHSIDWQPNPEALVRLAALNKVDTILPEESAIADPLLAAATSALEQLLEMRRIEGQAMLKDLQERLQSIAGLLEQIRQTSGDTVKNYREALFLRLRQADLDLDLSDERVLREIALFADRCDISEELTRLESHFNQFRDCLESGSPIGRKLEFILQEVNREFNTVGSKANNIEVNRMVIEAKNEIERIREQIQNVE